MALIDLEDLKSYMQISGPDKDLVLTTLLDEVQAMTLGSDIENSSRTDDFDGDDSNIRILMFRPVTAVSKVLTSIDNNTEIASTGYVIYKEGGIIRLKTNLFPKGLLNCRVKYTAGYTTATTPKELNLVLKELCALVYKISPHGDYRLGKRSINQPDGGTVNYTEKLPFESQKILKKYQFKHTFNF